MYSQEFGACSVQKGWREEIRVDLWLCRSSQAGAASQFAACAPRRLLQLHAPKCCPGLTGYQQDWLNQLLEKSPGSLSKHSISRAETRAVSVPRTDSRAGLFWVSWWQPETQPVPRGWRWAQLGTAGHRWQAQLGTAGHCWAPLAGTAGRHRAAERHIAMAPACVNHPRVTT